MSTVKYHQKRKKGGRSLFFRYKKSCQSDPEKENSPPQTPPLNLLTHWQASEDSSQYFKIGENVSGVCAVTTSLVINSDRSWCAQFQGKKVPPSCSMLSSISTIITSQEVLSELISVLDKATLCHGNSDAAFCDIYADKGGVVRGERGSGQTIAFLDSTPIPTIRKVDCDIICKGVNSCAACKSFRSTLRSALCRQKSSVQDVHTAASSHTKYATLTSEEKTSRMRQLHQSLISSKKHTQQLQLKVVQLIENHSVSLQEEDEADLSSIVAEVDKVVEEKYPEESPQRIFWDQQKKFNALKNKRQMRWHPLVLRFALNLKYMSTSAYKAMRQSGIIHLPSERTLADYTHWTTPHSGVQLEFVERYSSMLQDVPCGHRHSALSMDEMKIKSGLVFNKSNGTLVGFVDLGGVNRDIEMLVQVGSYAVLSEYLNLRMYRVSRQKTQVQESSQAMC